MSASSTFSFSTLDHLNGEVADIQLAVDALALDVADNFCETRVQAECISGFLPFIVWDSSEQNLSYLAGAHSRCV